MPRLAATASSVARNSWRRARRIVAPTAQARPQRRRVHPEVGLAEREVEQQEPAEADDAGRDAQVPTAGRSSRWVAIGPEATDDRLRQASAERPMRSARPADVEQAARRTIGPCRCPCTHLRPLPRTPAPAQTSPQTSYAAGSSPLSSVLALGTWCRAFDGWLRRPGRVPCWPTWVPRGSWRRSRPAPASPGATGRPPRWSARAASSPAGSPAVVPLAVASLVYYDGSTGPRAVFWMGVGPRRRRAGRRGRRRVGDVAPSAAGALAATALGLALAAEGVGPARRRPLVGRQRHRRAHRARPGRPRSACALWCSPAAALCGVVGTVGVLALAVPTATFVAAAPALLALHRPLTDTLATWSTR